MVSQTKKRIAGMLSFFVFSFALRIGMTQNNADIPVAFTLEKPGYVTLVVEAPETGKRIRNLIQDTYFDAGHHIVYWDGYNRGEKFVHPPKEPGSRKKAKHYDIHRRLVEPGTYHLRGLIHADVKLRYLTPVHSPGTPPWHTRDGSGAWLADHTPPGEALFLPRGSPHGKRPQIVISSLGSSEAGHSIMWLTLNGSKLYGGKVAGGFSSSPALARDTGKTSSERYYMYSLTKGKLYGFIKGASPKQGRNAMYEMLGKVEGLETTRAIGPFQVKVTGEMVKGKPEIRIDKPVPDKGKRTLVVIKRNRPLKVDGRLNDWKEAHWVPVSPERHIEGAVAIKDGRLYAAWRTNNSKLLDNNIAEGWKYVFATGGGLDLMIRTRPGAKLRRGGKRAGSRYDLASDGDVRLIITRRSDPETGEVVAVRFQQKAGRERGESITYRSPIGEVNFDSVQNISRQVKLAQKKGSYEICVPLNVIGFSPESGTTTLGDIGVLLGNGIETTGRYYWSNKSAGMVSDIPTEARLMPHEWGLWRRIAEMVLYSSGGHFRTLRNLLNGESSTASTKIR